MIRYSLSIDLHLMRSTYNKISPEIHVATVING